MLLSVKEIRKRLLRGNLVYYKKETIVLTRDRTDVPTITNTPWHPKTFKPMFDETEIECEAKRVKAGQHMHWIIVKYDTQRRQIIQREILA